MNSTCGTQDQVIDNMNLIEMLHIVLKYRPLFNLFDQSPSTATKKQIILFDKQSKRGQDLHLAKILRIIGPTQNLSYSEILQKLLAHANIDSSQISMINNDNPVNEYPQLIFMDNPYTLSSSDNLMNYHLVAYITETKHDTSERTVGIKEQDRSPINIISDLTNLVETQHILFTLMHRM